MRLPSRPLLDELARRGGLHGVLLGAGLEERSAAYIASAATVRRAKRSGRLTFTAADGFCVHILHCHPAEVFGAAWWATTNLLETS